jgi:hypothetical protein
MSFSNWTAHALQVPEESGGRTLLERSDASRLLADPAFKARFGRRRRKSRLGFDQLYRLFTSDMSFGEIARKAGVSRTRIRSIFDQYYRPHLRVSGLERRRKREQKGRDRVVEVFLRDRVMQAILKSAAKAKRKRTIEPIIYKRGTDLVRRFRHRAVLVDGKDLEPVHHIRNAQQFWPGGIVYGTTSLSRKSLETSTWTIFCIDVPSYRRRILRCRSAKLLKALFPVRAKRKHVYIPLDRKPNNPRYDFLADADNWA